MRPAPAPFTLATGERSRRRAHTYSMRTARRRQKSAGWRPLFLENSIYASDCSTEGRMVMRLLSAQISDAPDPSIRLLRTDAPDYRAYCEHVARWRGKSLDEEETFGDQIEDLVRRLLVA